MVIYFFIILALGMGGFLHLRNLRLKLLLRKREEDIKKKIYELAILKELGERIGYSLNVQNIVNIIAGSLQQFFEYSAVAYMLLEPKEIIFNIHCRESIPKIFINEVKTKMLQSLSALLNKDLAGIGIKEVISGSIIEEELPELAQSFFNIPLIISERVVGVLTIASKKAGLYKEEDMTLLYKIVNLASQSVTRLQEVVNTEGEKMNAMVESLEDGIVMVDKDYRILVMNLAAKKAVGLEKKEGITILDFSEKLYSKFDIHAKLEESIKLDKMLISDEILLGERFFKIIILPVKNSALVLKEVLGEIIIFRNITKEKEIARLREDFNAMLVHELRSPLDGIKKMIELIKEEDLYKEKQKYDEYMNLIHKSASEMLKLINDLLDSATLEAGKFKIYKIPANIKNIIKDRIKFFEASAKEARIDLVSQLDNNLLQKVNFDEVRISQVLNNLISNALKFTKGGGFITIGALMHRFGNTIIEEAKKAGLEHLFIKSIENLSNVPDSLVVIVADTGIGMSPSELNQLFNKFKQFKIAAPDKKGGTGLGLIIAKGIIETHGGIIGVVSEENIGSTFYFTIPINNQGM